MTNAEKLILRQWKYRWAEGEKVVDWITGVASAYDMDVGVVIWASVFYASRLVPEDDNEFFQEYLTYFPKND